MAGKVQYWLVTVKVDDCAGYSTFAISKHPADHMAENTRESLIFAMPITKQQFRAVYEAYCGN